MAKKKIEAKKGKQELLKDASTSSAWTEAIKPELESKIDMLSDILITLKIEETQGYKPGEIYIARRLASAMVQNVVNDVDTAGLLQQKSDEDKQKDSME